MIGNKKQTFWHLSCYDILSIVCAAAVPIALDIYTAITYQQESKHTKEIQDLTVTQAIQFRQDTIYDQFLKYIYNLDKDGYLNESEDPWAFANAYYRAAHRQLDPVWKADILQFLKEKQLIGRNNCTAECRPRNVKDIIRLNELSFDNIHLKSETGGRYPLNLACILFDEVSMSNAVFSHANLNGVSFDHSRLDNVKFGNSSLVCARFYGTDLGGADLRGSDLKGAHFENTNLTNTKLTEDQKKKATFINVIGQDGVMEPTTTTTRTTTLSTPTTPTSSVTTTTTRENIQTTNQETTSYVALTTSPKLTTQITTKAKTHATSQSSSTVIKTSPLATTTIVKSTIHATTIVMSTIHPTTIVTSTMYTSITTTAIATTTSSTTTVITSTPTTTSSTTTVTTSTPTTSVPAITTATLVATCTTLINFDDISNRSSNGGIIPNGYKNLKWVNAEYHNASTKLNNSNLQTAFRNSSFVMLNSPGQNITISTANGTRFSFESLYITSPTHSSFNFSIHFTTDEPISSLLYAHYSPYRWSILSLFVSFRNINSMIFEGKSHTPDDALADRYLQFAIDDMCISFHP